MENLLAFLPLVGYSSQIAVIVLTTLIIFLLGGLFMAQISFTVNITINAAAPAPLAPVTDPLNLTGTVGQPFNADLASNVTGGVPPYNFTVNGTLPDGLSASGSVVSGTPTTAGTTTLTVTVADSGQ